MSISSISNFRLGDKTTEIWCGDIVSHCEFICNLGEGRMLFYDITFKCFRRVFPEFRENNEIILNGWNCSHRPSLLI